MIDDETHRREVRAAFLAGAAWQASERKLADRAFHTGAPYEQTLAGEAADRYAAYVEWLRKERPNG
jgi:hypothetical protein